METYSCEYTQETCISTYIFLRNSLYQLEQKGAKATPVLREDGMLDSKCLIITRGSCQADVGQNVYLSRRKTKETDTSAAYLGPGFVMEKNITRAVEMCCEITIKTYVHYQKCQYQSMYVTFFAH